MICPHCGKAADDPAQADRMPFEELQKRLGMPRDRLRAAIKEGHIPGAAKHGNRFDIFRAPVERWIAQGVTPVAPIQTPFVRRHLYR